MRELTRIKNLVFNQPWAITPESMDTIAGILQTALTDPEAAARVEIKSEKSGLQVIDGVPVIPIVGPISKRANLFTRISGATSIDMLNSMFDDALESDAKAVIFHIDSPGGSVMGVPEFATRVHGEARNGDKVIVALADGLSASAAYWIGSQANEFLATEASVVGSIGVIARIVDFSRMEKNAGIDEEIFRSSDLKAAGAGPLQDVQRRKIQAEVSRFFDMFKNAVARGRENMDVDAVATGETWIGAEAVDRGLIDGITTLRELIGRYQ